MDRKQARKMFAERDPGLARLMRFNLRFIAEVDLKRLHAARPELDPAVWDRLLASRRATERLSLDLSWLDPGIEPGGFDMPAPELRLFLLPWPERRKALFMFGMAVRFLPLRQCVDGRELRRLAEAAGPEARAFALARGSLMLGNRVRALFPDNPGHGLFDRVEWAAAGAAAACLQNAPAAFAARALKTMPEPFERKIRMMRPFADAERRLAWSGLTKVITKEALPEWASFFA